MRNRGSILAASVDRRGRASYLARCPARSSNGKTTDSDSVNRGSNPRRASIPQVAAVRQRSNGTLKTAIFVALCFALDR